MSCTEPLGSARRRSRQSATRTAWIVSAGLRGSARSDACRPPALRSAFIARWPRLSWERFVNVLSNRAKLGEHVRVLVDERVGRERPRTDQELFEALHLRLATALEHRPRVAVVGAADED